jgi:osmotically-inducible protein OsmY
MRFRSTTAYLCVVTLATCLLCSAAAYADEVQDATTRAKIETAFLFNEHLNPFELKTTAQDGTVTLSGTVQTQVQKDLAEGIAKSVVGVKQVVNNISVASAPLAESRGDEWSALVNDATVTASVITRLLGVKDVDPTKVQVSTQGGVVTLTGEVATPEERERVEGIARTTRGVFNVRDNMQIRKEVEPVQAQAAAQTAERQPAVPPTAVKKPEPQPRKTPAPEKQPQVPESGVHEEPMRVEPPAQHKLPMAVPKAPVEERKPEKPAVREEPRPSAVAERLYRERSNEAQRLRREADDRREEARRDVQERQREFREEYGDVEEPERLSAARRDLRQDISEIRDEAEADAAKLEQRAQRIEREARSEYDEARRGTQPESKLEQEARAKANEVGQTLSDEWLEKRIELDLSLNRNVNMGGLDVEVNDGVATLSGTVTSDRERRLAQQIADSINGIRQVQNKIRVEPNPQS